MNRTRRTAKRRGQAWPENVKWYSGDPDDEAYCGAVEPDDCLGPGKEESAGQSTTQK